MKTQKRIVDRCKKSSVSPNALKEITLKQLMTLIKNQSSNNVKDLLPQFPPGIVGVKNTDSHVFEALWIIIFLFNYDNLKGKDESRHFYKNLEKLEEDERTEMKYFRRNKS